jgi:23S rRNA (cytidine1920-2'-O)/16S rRNA (cytidine1409-2'-O)-methyltransferase
LKTQKNKERVDVVIARQRPDLSRSLIQSWIKQGYVCIDGQLITKPGMLVEDDADITLTYDQPLYVSRSGAKLAQALQEFNIDVQGLHVLDVGLSTGGFTDCLLQHGAAHVYGVDVGTAQVHPKIAQDSRVTVMEQTDIRNCLGKIDPVDMIVVDVSFISVTKFIHVLLRLLKPLGKLIILIKPQFEGSAQDIARGGVVKNQVTRQQIMNNVVTGVQSHGFIVQGCVQCTTIGGDGNIEYVSFFIKN